MQKQDLYFNSHFELLVKYSVCYLFLQRLKNNVSLVMLYLPSISIGVVNGTLSFLIDYFFKHLTNSIL